MTNFALFLFHRVTDHEFSKELFDETLFLMSIVTSILILSFPVTDSMNLFIMLKFIPIYEAVILNVTVRIILSKTSRIDILII